MVRNRHGRLPVDEDQTQKVTRPAWVPRPAALGGGSEQTARRSRSVVPGPAWTRDPLSGFCLRPPEHG